MRTFNEEELKIIKKVVKESLTISETRKNLIKNNFSIGFYTLRRLINEYNICTNHFRPGKGHQNDKWTKYKICPICNKTFTVTRHNHKQITCQRSCGNKLFSGLNGSNYKGGYAIYRKTCFEKYEYKCLVCDENQLVHVHHIDHNRNNNVIENLIPLCPTHHLYMHQGLEHLIEDKIKEQINEK